MSCKMGRKKGVSLNDLIVMLCLPCDRIIKATCPGSWLARIPVFDAGLLSFLHLQSSHKKNSNLNRLDWFVADMLASFVLQIEAYDQRLMQRNIIGYTSALEPWPTLEKRDQVILSIWLMNDTRLRLGLVLDLYSDFDHKIVDHVMRWGKHRKDILKRAKSEFCRCYGFVQALSADNEMPYNLLSALLGEGQNVSPQKELALIKTDLVYCHSLMCIPRCGNKSV